MLLLLLLFGHVGAQEKKPSLAALLYLLSGRRRGGCQGSILERKGQSASEHGQRAFPSPRSVTPEPRHILSKWFAEKLLGALLPFLVGKATSERTGLRMDFSQILLRNSHWSCSDFTPGGDSLPFFQGAQGTISLHFSLSNPHPPPPAFILTISLWCRLA